MPLKIAKVVAVPGDVEPDTLYLTPSGTDRLEVAILDADDNLLALRQDADGAQTDLLLDGKVDKVEGKQLSTNDFTSSNSSKLSAVAAQATKNASDAFLKARANHTGTQAIGTITNLQSILNSKTDWFSGRFVSGGAELSQAMNEIPNQAEVFNSWTKFSINASGNYPAQAAELTAWAFDSANNRVYNTTNSNTYIGAVSDRAFDEYDLTVDVYSSNSDDDVISIVIAYYKDPATGKEYTLSVTRCPGGWSSLWDLTYNYNQGTANGAWKIVNGDPTVTWGRGQSGSLTSAQLNGEVGTLGWSQMAAFWGTNGKMRIRVKRSGDIIEAWTCQYATPSTLDQNTRLSVDLSSDARLSIFRGERPYGFAALSQASSYWDTVNFANPKDMIYDVETRRIYSYNGTSWVSAAGASFTTFKDGTIFGDPQTGKLFYKHPGGMISAIQVTAVV